ncbi:MAG: glutamine synthetase family protein [Acidimicrobiales bacterium]
MTTRSVEEVIAGLRANGIDVVRILISDLAGVDRGRDVLLDHFSTVLGADLALCRGLYGVTAGGGVIPLDGGLTAGLPDISVVPELDTLQTLPWEPGVAWCVGSVHSHGDGTVEEDPRSMVKSVLGRFDQWSLRPIIGPELEFFLLEPDASASLGYRIYGSQAGNVYSVGRRGDPDNLLLSWLRLLRDCGFEVLGGNHEFSPGQFEINLNHGEALATADAAFRFKIAVKELARREGKLATFMAKPLNSEGGSGFHLHVSLNDEHGVNVFDEPSGLGGLSDRARWSIAGIVAHAPALAALLNPTVNSYKRFGPDTLAPWLIDWGFDNRSAMVRIPPERGDGARLELRLGDASANPYLAIAGILGAIALGLERRLEPPEALEGYGYDPTRAEILPTSLTQALDALERDRELTEVLGAGAVAAFLEYKRDEVKRCEATVTDWEFREYAYHL